MRGLHFILIGAMTTSCSFFGFGDDDNSSDSNRGSGSAVITPVEKKHLFQSLNFFSKGKALGKGVYQVSDLVGLEIDPSKAFRCGDTLSIEG